MDFGVVGLDTLVCSNNGSLVSQNAAEGNSHKRYGSGFINQERAVNDDELRGYKVAKTSSCGEAMLKTPLQRSNEAHQQMLSFSSPNSQAMALPYYHHTSSPFSRNAGYGSAGINATSVLLTGFRGHFTASQWMELEHQALIYKYIDANVPIPSYLLNPIRKALESAGFTGFSSLRPTALGWGGGFHLGFSNSDPEPGRCRRTDGKKWRCSRDAVVDQKYCERHMNRGRHRSRKPVEGQSGNTNSNSILKPTPPMASSNIASVVPAAGRDAINLGLSHQANNNNNNHLSGLLPNINRNKENMEAEYRHTTVLSMNSISKERAYEQESSSTRPTEFGLVCSDSLLNPLNNHHPLRQFMDECPKSSRSKNPVIPNWSDVDRSREFEATKMGLGVGPSFSDQRWEPSMGMGGPLGEVLHYECNKRTESAALNLMESCWDNSNSPRLGVSSPTGVLQRCTFGSVSNSSAGSSPRAESGSGLIGMGLVQQHPSLPAP